METAPYWQGALAGAFVATAGLWWFRLILKDVQKLPRSTRFGVYALVWLAYFTLTLLVIDRTGG